MTNNYKDSYDRLVRVIHQTALEVAPDYPNIKTADPHEQLWAIRSEYLGTHYAVKDWQAFGYWVSKHYDIPREELVKGYMERYSGHERRNGDVEEQSE